MGAKGSLPFRTADLESTDIGDISGYLERERAVVQMRLVLRAQRAALTYFTGMYHSLLACTLWKLDA